ncbi:MAG: hypothetical protein OEV10_11210 [Gammaproteobacteria bacterium]|jgi:hypothetical protein|nr:hypothetical protein [Gammaproteobacteria bacterium]MDH3864522.1 hypothetical protein [Gammaproteobacteria bacterium]MDH3904233.1 hypothetical protein [Gammaproteobacteria bacterium]MDH3907837.1 hypothetical protein [Gammaproteobacteria bacterium]MDH4004992.1 hypothetical protein [Gammaproteobacteria bacterium]
MAPISAIKPNDVERPVLELSGDALRAGIQAMVTGAEEHGGIERYVDAVKLKSTMFQQAMDDIGNLELEAFMGLSTFMATVRRRIGSWLNEDSFGEVREGLAGLFDDDQPVDGRVETFCARFPNDKKHRWVRDLATEMLHNVDPERFPLMNRWVWDAKANTGVLREIWHGDNVDHITIPVGDGYGTYLMLREELSQFLSENGFFRDILQYVDILCAQVYAQYICEQGGSYLRADFSAPEDPMQHTRRLLGLDGVRPGSGRTRLKSIDGEAFVIDDTTLLN